MSTDRISQSLEEVEETKDGTTEKRPPSPPRDQPGTPGYPSRAESRALAAEAGGRGESKDENGESKGSGGGVDSYRQRLLGEELAASADKNVDHEVDETLDRVNPKYDANKSAYSENCTGVVQANELRRRGVDVEAGPLEVHRRTDQGGPGGRPVNVIEDPWNRRFTNGTKAEIEAEFQDPGARGVIYIQWYGNAGAHVFNVENVGGRVRFVDGQPTPPVTDAAHYFNLGDRTAYLRLDDLKAPEPDAVKPYLER